MQDRFKFRMWNKLSNEMKDVISINYNPDFPECSTVVAETNSFDKVKTHTMPITCANSFNNIILMQCTGLKDKNGELIYEGDILKLNILENFGVFGTDEKCVEIIAPIVFEDGGFFIEQSESSIFLGQFPMSEIEVIGNIFENSELLK